MRIIVGQSQREVAAAVADRIATLATTGSIEVLGVATGSSPSSVYRALSERAGKEISRLELFALDEYVGLPYSHNASYHAVVERDIRGPLRVYPSKVHVPDGMAGDLHHAAELYEQAISRAGGIDFQILGIGSNGHVAFNEPGSDFDSRTRVVALSPSTRSDNARFFDSPEDVPTNALTQGIGTIMQAREIVLVANGIAKAAAIAAAVEGPEDVNMPASILRRHPNVTLALDPGAASRLAYRSVSPQTAEGWQ